MGEYYQLRHVFRLAIEQAESGKGRERHAEVGENYEDQIICEVTRRVGLGYPLGQAVKKVYESQRLGGARGLDELLGAMNYLAAAFIVMQERVKAETAKEGAEFSAKLDKTADEMNAKVIERIVGQAKAAEEPQFNPGDKVEVHAMTERDIWETASIVQICEEEGFYRVKYPDGNVRLVRHSEIRPAPKAEGCEELVVSTFDEERMRQSMPGIVPQDGPSDMDVPKSKEELFQHIVDANPSVFKTHKPTGEELAEMAKEDAHG